LRWEPCRPFQASSPLTFAPTWRDWSFNRIREKAWSLSQNCTSLSQKQTASGKNGGFTSSGRDITIGRKALPGKIEGMESKTLMEAE
jgi:hypothetical protein